MEAGGSLPDVDVAVVGGGLAGVAAAIAAATAGARVRLLEAAPVLGGNASGAFVHTLCGLYQSVEEQSPPEPANPGLSMRFADGLAACGAAGPPERAGRVWVVPTDPQRIPAFAAEFCAAIPSLEVRRDAPLTSVDLARQPGEASRLTGGGQTFEAPIVIDTTGVGAVARIGQAEIERPPDATAQLPSYIAKLSGVPSGDREGFGRLRLAVALADASRRGALPGSCEAVLIRPAPGTEDAYVTLNISRKACEAQSSEELEHSAQDSIRQILEHLRATREGYEACAVRAWPRQVGYREGPRVQGERLIEAAPLLAGTRSEDEIALSTWPVELWHDHRRPLLRHPKGPFGIPLGALVSSTHPRLGMAGRCVSASHEALGALRVLGTALATGEAIGLAAALASRGGCGLGDVDPAEVNALRADLR